MDTVLFWLGVIILAIFATLILAYVLWLCSWCILLRKRNKGFQREFLYDDKKFSATTELQELKDKYEQR